MAAAERLAEAKPRQAREWARALPASVTAVTVTAVDPAVLAARSTFIRCARRRPCRAAPLALNESGAVGQSARQLQAHVMMTTRACCHDDNTR
jgi:hypothetical protein